MYFWNVTTATNRAENWVWFTNQRTGNWMHGALLVPSEARAIDVKLDDGVALSKGFMNGETAADAGGGLPFCELGGLYTLDNPEIACMLYFSVM